MNKQQKILRQFHFPYYGRILNGSYSSTLKRHVNEYILRFEAYDEISNPTLPYIAAWQKRRKTIWYEFVSQRLIEKLGCGYDEVPQVFRNSILERHRFIKRLNRKQLREEILISRQVRGRKHELRNEVIKRGTLEAVYKMRFGNGDTVWFKDQAVLEVFDNDGIYLSIGNLTDVTKEMELDEHLKHTQMALRKSRKKYHEQALHDNLTGLYNTRYLYRALSRLIVQSKKTKEPLSLIFMDIDNFKTVVDKNGHMVASKTLQAVAGTIKRIIKKPSVAVAYGGDEFVIALPRHTKQQALEKAELIRSRIKNSVYLKRAGLDIRVSASFGVSTFPDDAGTLGEILSLADQAMFAVKKERKGAVYSLS